MKSKKESPKKSDAGYSLEETAVSLANAIRPNHSTPTLTPETVAQIDANQHVVTHIVQPPLNAAQYQATLNQRRALFEQFRTIMAYQALHGSFEGANFPPKWIEWALKINARMQESKPHSGH